jgi:GrpB-like predicted nucleotidyltransferase (UPF0157 family)
MAGVLVVPYSAEWPGVFAALAEELHPVLVPLPVRLEHIGSTSIPGLSAKPVIDLLLGAQSLKDIESRIQALASIGFEYVSKYEREIPERRYFVRSQPNALRVHLHGVVRGGKLWRDHLAFRDALRADAALRDHYQELKLHLAAVHADDKAAYSEAKGPFIRSVMDSLKG